MPEICRFYGIIIRMFFADHSPPHFHVEYGSYNAIINIKTLSIIEGYLPPRAIGLVIEWASINKEELIYNWNEASNYNSLKKIPPLK